MSIQRNHPDQTKLNPKATLPFELRLNDFAMAMQDVYDFFHDVNVGLVEKGLERLDDMVRPAIMSGLLSDMLTASLGKHSRTLTGNCYFNGHPDLVVRGVYPDNCVKAGSEGVEVKTPEKRVAQLTLTVHVTSGCAFSCIRWTMKPSLPVNESR